MTARLFDTAAGGRRRHEWGRWLPIPAPSCCPRPACAGHLVRLPSATQLALFIHGGYGAAERSTYDLCGSCGWKRTVSTETVNPRRCRG